MYNTPVQIEIGLLWTLLNCALYVNKSGVESVVPRVHNRFCKELQTSALFGVALPLQGKFHSGAIHFAIGRDNLGIGDGERNRHGGYKLIQSLALIALVKGHNLTLYRRKGEFV